MILDFYNTIGMSQKFIKNIEDFTCENCGAEVKGNGYTNHCPVCLWGKHVDINPGDRAETCGGMMKPIGVILDSDGFIIYFKCQKCGIERKNKSAKNDDISAIIKTPFGAQ
jgi:hypothetical protein